METARFPALHGEALDGAPFRAPDDLLGARSVALLGFGLEQRAEIESWGSTLEALAREGAVRARLFPALGPSNALVRGMIVTTLKAALPSRELRAATIPLFTDVDALCAALGIADRTHVAVLVLDGDGAVAWRGAGAYDAKLGAALRAALHAPA